MWREICRATLQHRFNYAFIMDADTAVNRTNLQNFASHLRLTDSIYTGLCKRRFSTERKHLLRGVGGGPGILLSRALLRRTCPALEHRSWVQLPSTLC